MTKQGSIVVHLTDNIENLGYSVLHGTVSDVIFTLVESTDWCWGQATQIRHGEVNIRLTLGFKLHNERQKVQRTHEGAEKFITKEKGL